MACNSRDWMFAAAITAAIGAIACDDKWSSKSARPMSVVRDQTSLNPDVPVQAGPIIGAVTRKVPIRSGPSQDASVLGFATAGAVLGRSEAPAGREGCPGGWYSVLPRGYLCSNDQTTTESHHPTLQARDLAPDRAAALPYPYAVTLRASTSYEPDPQHQDGVRERGSIGKGSTFAVVGSWNTLDEYDQQRHLALLTLGVFVPTRDIKPVRLGSAPGFAIDVAAAKWPLGLPIATKTPVYRVIGSNAVANGFLETGHPIALTVKSRTLESQRYLQMTNDAYVAERDVRVVRQRQEFPDFVSASIRWIDVDLVQGIVILYDGKQPRYVTRISEPPSNQLPRGVAWVRAKQISCLDFGTSANENSIHHFDTPWVVELDTGVSIHAAIGPTQAGSAATPNTLVLFPEDAAKVFHFVLPDVPNGWHVVNADASHRNSSPVLLR